MIPNLEIYRVAKLLLDRHGRPHASLLVGQISCSSNAASRAPRSGHARKERMQDQLASFAYHGQWVRRRWF
jgi:hypothetical protein